MSRDGEQAQQRLETQVARWRDDLLDLTGRNRLLRFRHNRVSSLEVSAPTPQAIVDKLLTGRSRELKLFIPEDRVEAPELDPTASAVGLGGPRTRPGVTPELLAALEPLAQGEDPATVYLTLGALQWSDDGRQRSAVLLHVKAQMRRRGTGWWLAIEEPAVRSNEALLAHFERSYDFTLSEEPTRIVSAEHARYFEDLRVALAGLDARVDDRIGILSEAEHARLLDGELELTPRVLISEGPRDGVLAALVAAEETGLPLVVSKRAVLAPSPPPPPPAPDELQTTKRLGKEVRSAAAALDRRATQEFMDKGLWVLYLGVGMLHWSDPADGRAEFQDSPLLLIPVRLTSGKRGVTWKLTPTEDEVLVNPALWLKLESDLEITLPQADDELDLPVFLESVRTAVGERPGWLVEERAVLSTFSFHKEVMYRDLRDNMATILAHPVVQSLARDPSDGPAATSFDFEPVEEADIDAIAPPERMATIRDADASQRQCILAAREGRSFVMDGPPGTGKSQTIANMIAELIADGKTVLFVSEKAAALDVVHDRLTQVGLDEYVLELHSHKTTRPVVAGALGASLLRKPRPAPKLSDGELRVAGERRAGLNAYASWLNEPLDGFGRSLHVLLGQIAELQHLPQAPISSRPVTSSDGIAAVTEAARQLQATWSVVERGDDFEWRGTTLASWGAGVEQKLLVVLDELDEALAALGETTEDAASDLGLLELAGSGRAAQQLLELIDLAGGRPDGVLAGWLQAPDLAPVVRLAEEVIGRAAEHAAAASVLASEIGAPFSFPGDVPGVSRVVDEALELGALRRFASDAEAARASLPPLIALARDAAARLGLQAGSIDLDGADRLVELLAIASSAAPPRPSWMDAEGAARAAAAVRELRPKLDALRSARAEASAFEESALELELVELQRRFLEEHTGFSKFGGAFKADRAQLAATTPGLKPKAAIAQIGSAVAWQAVHRELAASTEAIGSLVDAWIGVDTDLDAVEARTSVAARALELAAVDVADPRRFADAVAGARDPGGLRTLWSQLDAAVAQTASALPSGLRGIELRELDDELAAAGRALVPLVELVSAADAARGRAGSLASARAGLAAARTLTRLEGVHADQSPEVLGAWTSLQVDAGALRAALTWAASVRSVLGGPVRPRGAERLVSARVDRSRLAEAVTRFDAAVLALLADFAADRHADLAEDLRADFEDAAGLLARLRQHRGDIEVWIAFARAKEVFAGMGLDGAVAFCEQRPVPAKDVVDVLVRSALETVAVAALAGSTQPLASRERDRIVGEFAADDKRVIADANHRVMTAANGRRPSTILGVAQIIQNEAAKKRRHMPVSELLKRTASVAQALKPCFMMSPLSVSQFLAPEMHFDVVIFDEASQVRPSDAINALYRGSAMIVAGDQKQLPPTDFFNTGGDESDEWSDDALQDFDSVLDLAKGAGAFRALSLRWHYRSRHEHLIAFSNHRFYDGNLVTFPGPIEQSEELGVGFYPVEGVYRRGTTRDNPVEALAIVDRVFAHAEAGSRSIGVVAFSEAQASLIEEVLRRDVRREDPANAWMFGEDRLGGLFVKNLENAAIQLALELAVERLTAAGSLARRDNDLLSAP